MTRNVLVADYGIGNLLSVSRAFEHVGVNVNLSSVPEEIRSADRLVVPGVGAFGDCMSELRRRNMLEEVASFFETGRPCLGICVGMQILFDSSSEFGGHLGLGHIKGNVDRIPETGSDGRRHKIPFVGWAKVRRNDLGMRELEVPDGEAFYFVHSFAAQPMERQYLLASYDYDGLEVAALVKKDGVVGCQFHPEKSGRAGLSFLEAFVRM